MGEVALATRLRQIVDGIVAEAAGDEEPLSRAAAYLMVADHPENEVERLREDGITCTEDEVAAWCVREIGLLPMLVDVAETFTLLKAQHLADMSLEKRDAFSKLEAELGDAMRKFAPTGAAS